MEDIIISSRVSSAAAKVAAVMACRETNRALQEPGIACSPTNGNLVVAIILKGARSLTLRPTRFEKSLSSFGAAEGLNGKGRRL